MNHKISLLIPIGRFSYFVHACLKNIFETCGAQNKLDLIFITSKDVDPHIEQAFKNAAIYYPFKVFKAPFNTGSNHLLLLDWAFRSLDLSEWTVIQHCDLFWTKSGWLNHIINATATNAIVLSEPNQSKFKINNTVMQIIGDYFGVYKVKEIIKRNLFFNWGILGKDVLVSQRLENNIKNGIISRINNDKPILFDDEFMDGSQTMAWELYTENHRLIKQINDLKFIHLVGFFRIADSIQKNNQTLYFKYGFGEIGLDLLSYFYYSYLTCFCMNRNEVENITIPWNLLVNMNYDHKKEMEIIKNVGPWLKNMSKAKDVVGLKPLGLNTLDFKGKVFKREIKLL